MKTLPSSERKLKDRKIANFIKNVIPIKPKEYIRKETKPNV